MTMTETHRPRQFEGQETPAEKRFDEVMASIKDLIPRKAWIELVDLTARRAIDAYDLGVLVGLGKLTPDDLTLTPDAMDGVSKALEGLAVWTRLMADRA